MNSISNLKRETKELDEVEAIISEMESFGISRIKIHHYITPELNDAHYESDLFLEIKSNKNSKHILKLNKIEAKTDGREAVDYYIEHNGYYVSGYFGNQEHRMISSYNRLIQLAENTYSKSIEEISEGRFHYL
jgi:hypothetical protein